MEKYGIGFLVTFLAIPMLTQAKSVGLDKQERRVTKEIKKDDKKLDAKGEKLERLEDKDKGQKKQEALARDIQKIEQQKAQALQKQQKIQSARWELPDPRLRLDQISFLGAHNALENEQDGWIYAQQKWNLKKLLEEGIRVIEFDLGIHEGKLHICHGECNTEVSRFIKTGNIFDGNFKKFKEKIENLFEWTQDNPDEVVIVLLDNKRDEKIHPNAVDGELITMPNITKSMLTLKDWDPEQHDGEWPTLEWMREHKKQIVIFNPKKNDSVMFTYYQWKYVGCTPPGTTDPEETAHLRSDSLMAFSVAQDQERKELQRFFQLNHTTPISEQAAIDAYKFQNKARRSLKETFGTAKSKKEGGGRTAKKILDKSKLSDNKRLTLLEVVNTSKKKGLMGGKNPNFLMLDWVDKFVNDYGFLLINQWNQEAEEKLEEDESVSGLTQEE